MQVPFYQSRRERSRRSRGRAATRAASLLTLAILLSAAGCSRLEVEWTGTPDGLEVTARGFTNADLIVIAGNPSTPQLRRSVPEVWTTIGPTPQVPEIHVSQVPFDEHGVARTKVPLERLKLSGTLVQALAIAHAAEWTPIGVSACKAVRIEDGVPVARSHALEVLSSRTGPRLLAIAALILACVLLRRLDIRAGAGRGPAIAALFLFAGYLLLARAAPSSRHDVWYEAEPVPPIFPPRVSSAQAAQDPLDRVSRPGFRELVEHARAQVPAGSAVAILPASDSGPAQRDAWQASWHVWPRDARILKVGDDPLASRGHYLLIGESRRDAGPNVRVLFANEAGAVWFVPEGAPR
jgi:hypothetical protein